MKNYFGNFKIVLLFAALLALMAFTPTVFPASASPPGGKPLMRSDGNFPTTIYYITADENTWMEPGLSVFSMFMVENQYFASGEEIIIADHMYVKAYSNTGNDNIYAPDVTVVTSKDPVKTGFTKDETVYWGLWDGKVMKELILTQTYKLDGDIRAVFDVTSNIITVNDNPYWSINPLWPDDMTLKIKPPTVTNRDYFLYNITYSGKEGKLYQPKYLLNLQWEMVEGTSKVKNSKDKKTGVYFLNQAKFRFSQADITKGYITVKLFGTPYKNSTSDDIARVYKIYWK